MAVINDYYLGLDMGTSSVGWAVTDADYHILRAKGKDLWGVREFEEAETSAERRAFRVSRRRRQREVARIGLLKEYFHDEIAKIDPNFYARLDNSKYHLEDKDENVRYLNSVFNDNNYKDRDYFTQYPTIFHLRKELIENPNPHDIRLVYLALLNMFKHRGHFLNASIGTDDVVSSMAVLYPHLCEVLENLAINDGKTILNSDADFNEIESVLSSKEYSRKFKCEKLLDFLAVDRKNKALVEIIKGISGLSIDLTKIFGETAVDSEGKKLGISFSDYRYDEKIVVLEDNLSESNMELISTMKGIYDCAALSLLLGKETDPAKRFLSFERVKSYDKHKYDLKVLKNLFRKYLSDEEYDNVFRNHVDGSYSAYVNSSNSNKTDGKKFRRNIKERRVEDLYANIKKILNRIPDSQDKTYILEEIEKDQFLPKQLTASNGIIPNQIHVMEMKAILKNAEKYLPFLIEKDLRGLTVSDRIVKLFTFTIPYYIGPTSLKSEKMHGNGWVVRKEEGQVLPWNIYDKVDVSATRERFIDRLILDCTYLTGEKVLPKSSLLYEKFCVLNEINNIRVAGEKIPVEVKQGIYTSLFEKGKKVSRKSIENYLIINGIVQADNIADISGIDTDINSSLSSYGKFHSIFGEKIREDKYKNISEDIIRLGTIYGDAKNVFKEIIIDKYGELLDEKQISRICGFKFKDWGRLSKAFLEIDGIDKSTGEILTLINALWSTNNNLNELLSENFTFSEKLNEKSGLALKSLKEINYEDLEDMYFSAPVKRMVWQTLLIIKELEYVIGHPPKKVFVEMTRKEEEVKTRKDSRKKQFQELYKSIKDESVDWMSIIEKADGDGYLRSKKMFLYLTQMGRSMYTGNHIDLSELFDDNKYDIDHIYPQHFVKDDNLSNNMVLVEKEKNNHKKDIYPIEASIRSSQREFWRKLLDRGLITKEKYDRLTGSSPFTDEQLSGFIARQLVETAQGTKSVANILQQIMPDTKIVFSKAKNVSDFRKDYELLKSRNVNEFHHAHDAYLNIVVGNAYDVKFTSNPYVFIQKEYKKDPEKFKYSLGHMFNHDIERNGVFGWDSRRNGSIAIVKKTMGKPSPLITRMNFEGHGGISKIQPVSLKELNEEKASNYLSLKSKNDKLQNKLAYGGYDKPSNSFFALIEYEKKGKKMRAIEAVPLHLVEKYKKNEEILLSYVSHRYGWEKPSIRIHRICKHSLIKINGYYLYIASKYDENNNSFLNAVQLILNQELCNYCKIIENPVGNREKISTSKNIQLFDTILDKHKNTVLKNKPKPIADILNDKRNQFILLDEEKQIKVLFELLKSTSVTPKEIVLSDLEIPKIKAGLTKAKNISGNEECLLINQSVTGLFESKIDLLTI